MNTETDGNILRLLDGECEGEVKQMSVHTPQTESGDQTEEVTAAGGPTDKEREARFYALMEGEYKDLFTAYFQQTFNRRFKEHKQMGEELESARAIKAAAAERFGTEDTDALLAAIRAKDVKAAPTEAVQAAATVSEEKKERAESDRRAVEEQVCRLLLAEIRARGLRPMENGLSLHLAPTLGGAAAMTRDERAELARRAAKGERISL